MLNSRFIPTPLIPAETRDQIVTAEITSDKKLRVSYLIKELIKLSLVLLRLKLTRRADAATVGQHLGDFFQRMGVLWVKIGQLLSLRVDLFPRELCDELSKLQDQAQGFDPAIAKSLIEADLGCPIGRVFDQFDARPFAAASISQVHRARLKDQQTRVAIKVRKPDAQQSFARDMKVIRWLLVSLDRWSIGAHMRWTDMLWEIEQLMEEELDYSFEVSNMKRMRKRLRRHNIYVPKVYAQFSSQRILVMEFVQGVLMSDYLKVAHQAPERLANWHKENNVDPEKLGKALFYSNLRQLFEDNLFHGDLHPGNIVLLRNSRIAFIDFGSVGFSDTDFLEKYALYLEAMVNKQYAKVFDIYLLFPDSIPATDLSDLKDVFVTKLQQWEERSNIRDLPYEEKNISALNDSLLGVLGEYRIAMTWSVLRFMRAHTTLDAGIRELIPRTSVHSLLKKYFSKRTRRLTEKSKKTQRDFALSVLPGIATYPINVHESMVFRGSVIRRLAQVFEGTTSTIADGLLAFFSLATWTTRLTGLYLLLAFVDTNYRTYTFSPIIEGWIDEVSVLPELDAQVWLLVLFMWFYVHSNLQQLRKQCKETNLNSATA